MSMFAQTAKPASAGGSRTAWILLAIAAVANAAGYFLDLWGLIGWYDDVVHGYTVFALTLVLALYLYGVTLTGASEHRFLFVLTVASAGIALGALWEVAEWGYDQWLAETDAIQGKRDTILDLVWDSIGALAAGVVSAWMVDRD